MITGTLPGLRRIVVLEARQIAYAEIELSNATQLIGGNGRGKTSIINTLQFLYVPDERRWFFGKYTPRDSKDFYFPPEQVEFSRVIFEVMTPTGMSIVGVRRKNALSSELEHFCAEGAFDRNDFISATREVRPWAKVKDQLEAKNFRIIKDLQNCLTSQNGTINLGLVPLRKGSTSDLFEVKFVGTFQRMLRLQALTQSDMQQILIDSAGIGRDSISFNPRDEWDGPISKFLKDFENTRQLKDIAPLIEAASKAHENFLSLGAWIIAAHRAIHARKIEEYDAITAGTVPLKEQLQAIRASAETLISGHSNAVSAENASRERVGAVKAEIQKISDSESAYRALNFDLPTKMMERSALDGDIQALSARIGMATIEPLPALKARKATLDSTIQREESEAERFEHLLINHLRPHLSDATLEKAFGIIDPRLLAKREGDEFAILDIPVLVQQIQGVADRVDGGRYKDDSLSIKVTGAASADLQRLKSVETIRASLAANRQASESLGKQISAAESIEALKTNRSALEVELEKVVKEILTYEAHTALVESLPRLRTDLSEAETELAALAAATVAAGQAIRENHAEETRLKELIAGKDALLASLRKTVDNLPAPVLQDEAAAEEPVIEFIDLFSTATNYMIRHADHVDAAKRWKGMSHDLETRLSDRYTKIGITHRDRLKALMEEVASLPQRQALIEKQFRTFISSISASFNALLLSVGKIKDAAREITREFARLKVSNIESITCEASANVTEINEITSLKDMDPEIGLFSDSEKATDIISKARARWQTHPTYHLGELFRVRLEIKKPGCQAMSYDEFDKDAGSNGQVITLKALINLLVIGTYLAPKREARLPFYVDEVASLDRENRETVQQFASSRGFVGLYAAPEPAYGMDRYYSLADGGNRVVVREEHMQTIRWKARDHT